MSRRSSEDEYAALDEEEKLLLADIYPELKQKLEQSIERSRKKRQPIRKAAQPVPVFDVSSDEEDEVKQEVVDDDDVIVDEADARNARILEELHRRELGDHGSACPHISRQSEEYSFHSAKSSQEQGNVSASSDSLSPPRSFTAPKGDHMDGSFVVSPHGSSNSEFDEIEADEQEPEGESLNEEDDRRRDDEEESIHSSDDDFIDDGDEGNSDEDMSIDESFRADVGIQTPPNKRVLPQRSTRNQQFTTTGKSIVPERRKEAPGAISPSMSAEHRPSTPAERSDDDDGEESFERYLRKLRDEDARKKKQQQDELMSEDEEEEAGGKEDSFVVSDESDDVIDDDYENDDGSPEPDEEELSDWRESGDSSLSEDDDDKENRRTTTKGKKDVKEEKPAKKKNLLLDLADSFNSPSVRAVDKDARDPDRHFLLSLSENYDGARRHADAEAIRKRGVKGEKARAALVARLFEMYNREIFEDKLPSDLAITFNARLRKTAGYCKWSSRASKCTIELSPKVCDQPDRIRDTLAHELCHAAVFVVNRLLKDRHGPVWQAWARKFSVRFRGFPVPSRCHNYDIAAKFVYACDGCGQLIKRHSKSFNTEKKCCGICHGRFHLLENETNDKKKRAPNGFALYVQENYGGEKKRGGTHKEIMQLLSARFKAAKEDRKEQVNDDEREVAHLDLDMSVMSIQEE